MLDEDEVVTVKDLEPEYDSVFDVETDFTELNIKEESNVTEVQSEATVSENEMQTEIVTEENNETEESAAVDMEMPVSENDETYETEPLPETELEEPATETECSTFADENTAEDQNQVMDDDVTKLLISKTDVTGSQEIPGAKLTILDTDDQVIIRCRSGYKQENGKCVMTPQPGLLQELTGTDVRDFTFTSPAEEKVYADWNGQKVEMPLFNDIMDIAENAEEVKVLATYNNSYYKGKIAIAEKKYLFVLNFQSSEQKLKLKKEMKRLFGGIAAMGDVILAAYETEVFEV